ncbi:MAG: GNAT family N-acetyltransferase [Thermoplasmata archaeon]|nr:GNAT family N-acetyltransferase [Thermoplasmata archaeon]MCI4353877.1 GNAT family N-acetyltransferase [Thermoplasmata archaeon]
MLRPFRREDGAKLFALTGRYFPEEGELLRWRPGAFDAVVARVFRPDVRFLLWTMEKLRHPLFKALVLEADGQLAGAALLTFPSRAGYISTVVVDEPFRGRGYATQIVHAAEAAAFRAGKRFSVLDVLVTNAPARALYAKLGYHLLRSQSYYFRDADGPGPEEAAVPGIRPFARRDAKPLARLALAHLPPPVAEVLPPHPRDFTVTPLVALGLDTESSAWVVDRGHGVEGFVRGTVSSATESGNLTAPLLSPDVPEATGRALVRTATDWIHRHSVRRIVCELPTHNATGLGVLAREGFREAFGLETLYRSLPA